MAGVFRGAFSVTTPSRWHIYRSVAFFAVLSSGAAVAGGLFGKKEAAPAAEAPIEAPPLVVEAPAAPPAPSPWLAVAPGA